MKNNRENRLKVSKTWNSSHFNINENYDKTEEFTQKNSDTIANSSSQLLIETLIHENLNLKSKIKDLEDALRLKEKIDETNQGKV